MFRRIKNRVWQHGESFSFVGLSVAAIFFAASVTPSLLPRIYIVQGLLSGIAVAVGYCVGVLLVNFYNFLELPKFSSMNQRIAKWISLVCVVILTIVCARKMTFWQNSIRDLMEMEPLESAYPYRVTFIAIAVGWVLVICLRTFRYLGDFIADKFAKIIPRRIAVVVGYGLLVFLVLIVSNDLVAVRLLGAADTFFLKIDQFVDEDLSEPEESYLVGSKDSLVDWDSIGKQGKIFLTTGPTQSEISDFHPNSSQRPIRVYVGMRTEDNPRERAKLALQELQRVGGFDRSVLIVATPTGTGWLDPSAVDTIEYLHGGDTAIVATQYSYLPSWMTIMVDPRRSIESAIALFDEVYSYWKTLAVEDRPKLYLFGLSLGSLGSESSADLLTIFEDPIQGGVWSGPPFPSHEWKQIVTHRNKNSPLWLPEYRDERIIRFTAQENALDPDKPWGAMRYVYVQYASDPMVWFSPELAWVRPDWLIGERGPDVSRELRWYPIITFLQIGCDIPMATAVPLGYGHNYSPSSYIDAWIAVTSPQDWTEEKTMKLKAQFREKGAPKPM